MIIIFGNKVRYKTLSTGQFYCPQCKAQRDYELRQGRNWFSIYFIPIIPLNQLGEFVTCLTCGTNFQQEVLAMPIPSNTPLDRMTREARADLDGGTPIEMARQKLINTGLSRELGREGIRVNTVSPGWVFTERQVEEYFAGPQAAKFLDYLAQHQAIPLQMKARDVANHIVFYLSEVSRASTGHNCVVDAGWLLE